MLSKKIVLLNLILIFFLGFAFVYTCYVGLPYDFGADHLRNIRGVESVSFGELFKLVIDPRTPVWFYPPGNRADLMAYVRPLQFLLIKAYYSFFGYSLPHIHTVAAVGCGILLSFFFLFTVFWTGSILWGWLAALLYLSFPSNVFMFFSACAEDSQFFLSAFSISSLLLLGSLTSGRSKRSAFGIRLFFWVLFTWLAIKLKSSEKILPGVFLAFIVWQFRSIRAMIGLRRIVILALTLVGMLLLVVPSQSSYRQFLQKVQRVDSSLASVDPSSATRKDQKALSFKWQNAFKRTFYASDEKFSMRSVYHREKNPLSFTENYGFLLGTFFWLGLFFVILLWLGLKTRYPLPERLPHREFFPHFFKLFFVWFGVILAGFSSGMDLSENRFLNFAYVPSIFLLFMMIGAVSKYFETSTVKSRIFRTLAVLIITATVLSNLIVFTKLLGFYGGRGSALVQAEKDIFPIVYGKAPDGLSLYENHQDLERRAVTVSWYEYPKSWSEITLDKLKTEKSVFLYLKTPDSEGLASLKEKGLEVTFWKKYSFFDAESLLFHILKKIDRLRNSDTDIPGTALWVYKVQRSPAGPA